MRDFDFNKIVYHAPKDSKGDSYIKEVIGFDSESYENGAPFLFCTSTGDSFTPKTLLNGLFTKKYRSKHFGCWNLRFDAGAVLYYMPLVNMNELRETGKTDLEGRTYKYIPHKFLRISEGKRAVTFWDIYQFFSMSLDKASKKYLGECKHEMETKTFSVSYVRRKRDKIINYCIQDAVLVAKLFDYLLKGLLKMDIKPKYIYSTASLAFLYFKDRGLLKDVSRYWNEYREVLRFACEAYAGGKFDIYRRGRFNGILYDINSAYPYEMSQLLNVDAARVVFTDKYISDAAYGFLRVYIDNVRAASLPVPFKHGLLSVYPAGKYYATITLNEYKYLLEIKVNARILSAYYLILDCKRRVYASAIKELYDKKTEYKNKDPRLYMLCKILMNGYYGKMAQLIKTEDGEVKAGAAWHPIYAATITANVRIRLSRLYNEDPESIIAVHTDSILCRKPLPGRLLSDTLGKWHKETEGEGVAVASGIYQINDKMALRGFMLTTGENLVDILKRMGRASRLNIPQVNVQSWTLASFRENKDKLNKFITEDKIFDVNNERKRRWPGKTCGNKLLAGLEASGPLCVMQ